MTRVTLADTLDDLLRDAATRAERGFSFVRAGVGTTMLFLPSVASLATGWYPPAGRIAGLGLAGALAIGLSVAFLYASKNTQPRRGWFGAATLGDALIIMVVVMVEVIWSLPGHVGVMRSLPTAGLLLAPIVAALRQSRTLVIMSLVANGLTGVIALLVDAHINAAVVVPLGEHAPLAVFMFAGAGGLSLVISHTTRRLVFESARTALEAARARQHLGVYVSEEVATQALTQEVLQPGGELREVAVLFSDLRGFTAYSQRLAPERLVAELNDYLGDMVLEIRNNGGIVDKYIGDAIMAVFGLTGEPDPATRAVRTAAGMERALERHNLGRMARGRVPFAHGIGVHFGPVVAGNVGTKGRLQYTVIGDTVNTAARLESLTRECGVRVIISADAARAADPACIPALRSLGGASLRGREDQVQILTFEE